MENMKEGLIRLFYKNFQKHSLEQKYTIVISILTSFGSILAVLANIVLNNSTIIIVSSVCSIIYITCFLLVRFRKYFRLVSWLLIINTIVLSDFNWYHFGGSKGSSLLILLILVLFGPLILKKTERFLGVIIIMINIGTLFYLEYNYPQLVRPYTSELNRIVDISVAFFLSVFVILMFMFSILKYYNREKANAEKADKLKSAFLRNISHELRTPMNAINGFVDLLTYEDISEVQHTTYCNYIKTASKGLEQLITNIINIAQIESKQLPVIKEKSDINEILTYVYVYFKDTLDSNKKNKVKLILNIDSTKKKYYINTDQYHLRQVLIYLIDNALKFTKKGYVEFGYQNHNSNIQFYVKDTGIGMQKEKKDIVFNSFLQLDNSISRKYAGTGLGLAISKGLVELMGGKIWFESEKNKGSTFCFTIPV